MTKHDNAKGQDVEPQILEEQPTEQQLIPFMGDDLAAVMTANGSIYVTLPGICAALGIDITGQLRRIRRTRALNAGLRRIPLRTRGGVQQINCLSIDKIALWLAGMQTAQVSPIFREKIERYQDELAPVATRVFMQVMGIAHAPTAAITDPRLAALAEQYDMLMSAATFISEHMEDLAGLPGQVQGVADQLAQAVQLLEALAQQQGETTKQVRQLTREQTLSECVCRDPQHPVRRLAEFFCAICGSALRLAPRQNKRAYSDGCTSSISTPLVPLG